MIVRDGTCDERQIRVWRKDRSSSTELTESVIARERAVTENGGSTEVGGQSSAFGAIALGMIATNRAGFDGNVSGSETAAVREVSSSEVVGDRGMTDDQISGGNTAALPVIASREVLTNYGALDGERRSADAAPVATIAAVTEISTTAAAASSTLPSGKW